MKQKLMKYLLLVTVLVTTIVACQKENEALVETSSKLETIEKASRVDTEHLRELLREYNGRSVEANFVGRVIDDADNPIQGAVVDLGGQQQTTDQNGIVTFMNADVQENFAYASVSAQGYTNGSRVMVPNHEPDNQNMFTVKLFSLENSQIIPSTGGEVIVETELGREAIVYFDNGFIDENGNPYTGNVLVNANYLDPLAEDTANTMPGDLNGIDKDYQEVALGSYGMIHVELRGSMGQKLQIASTAKIALPIHPEQMATAADSVPMWSFNETIGTWVEEEVAYKDGEYYIAEVSHFSFWNCDAPFPVISFTATVVDANTGIPLSGVKVTINYSGFVRHAITNGNGNVSGKIPSGQTMTFTVSTSPCGTVLFNNSSFGPFTSSTNITIPVTVPTQQLINVSGTVTNCSAQNVTNGYVTYSSTAGQFGGVSLVTAGTHNYTSVSCVSPVNIDLEAGDMDTGQVIATTTVTANPNAIVNLNICGGVATEYIRYSVGTGTLTYETINPYAVVEVPNFVTMGASRPGNMGTTINGNVTTVTAGIPFNSNPFATGAPASMVIKRLGHPDGIDVIATVNAINSGTITNPIVFNITYFGPVNDYIDVNFSGEYIDNLGNLRIISGDAHLLRDY